MNQVYMMMKNSKSDSEEEGEILSTNDSNPKDFKANQHLNYTQLQSFLIYYSETSQTEFKYQKTQLNKINLILHNHYHLISKDLKLFKLYKSFIQLVTQEMHDWIEKDFYCSDVITELLKEAESHKDNPKYLKIFTKLRLEEIIRKLEEKAGAMRRKAEEERLSMKRSKNWEKKQKKQKSKVDPFESIPLPQKRAASAVKDEEPSQFGGQKTGKISPDMDSKISNSLCENKVTSLEIDQSEKLFFEDMLKFCMPSADIFDSLCEEAPKPEIITQPIHEIEEWFFCVTENRLIEKIEEFPDKRESAPKLDPRIEIHLKCRGFDFVLDNPMLSSRLEKFQIVINLKCLMYVREVNEVLHLKTQIPKETKRIYYKDVEYLVCYRPHWREFLDVARKCSEIYIFSLFPEDFSEKLVPGFKVISSKCYDFNKDVLILFDNEKIGWNQFFLVSLLYYDPFFIEEKMMINRKLCNLRDKDLISFCNQEGEAQLEGLYRMIINVYSNFIENTFQFTAISEFRKFKALIFKDLTFDCSFYEGKIGNRGYTQQKLEMYRLLIEEMGGEVTNNGRYVLVESRSAEKEVSGKWIISCFLNFKFLEKA